MITFSNNVLKSLEAATGSAPLLSTERGDFFAVSELPIGALRLRCPLEIYLDFVTKANEGKILAFLLPCQNPKFHVIVNTQVTVRDGRAFVGGEEFKLL